MWPFNKKDPKVYETIDETVFELEGVTTILGLKEDPIMDYCIYEIQLDEEGKILKHTCTHKAEPWISYKNKLCSYKKALNGDPWFKRILYRKKD